MKNILSLVMLLCILLALSTACATSTSKVLKSGDRPIYIDLSTLKFTAQSVEGQVQIKQGRKSAWRNLQPGETFNGLASIRTGFRSNAELVMKNGDENKTVSCKVGSLLCATSMRDVYGRVLHPDAIKDYYERMWGDPDSIDPDAPILVTRSTLRGEDPDTLLAEGVEAMSVRSQDTGAAATGGAGAAGGGSGGSGGGCSGGS
jgi:hypothetical protein